MVLAVLIAASLYLSELRPSVIFSMAGIAAAAQFLGGLFPPNTSPDFLRLVARATLETVAIGVAGTTLAITFATLLGPFGASSVMGTRTVTTPTRFLLSFVRSVPDLVWAVFFVRIVGLGPFAGVLAIGVSYGGILGKMYGELLDAAPRAPIEAIAGVGAGRTGQFVYAILPRPGTTWSAIPCTGGNAPSVRRHFSASWAPVDWVRRLKSRCGCSSTRKSARSSLP